MRRLKREGFILVGNSPRPESFYMPCGAPCLGMREFSNAENLKSMPVLGFWMRALAIRMDPQGRDKNQI